jgi:DNA-binding response OmpR family regulator
MNAVVVHEDAAVRGAAANALSCAGFSVDIVGDWTTAARKLRTGALQLLVTAPFLRETDVLASVAALEGTTRFAVVAIVPNDLAALGPLSLDRGADDYLPVAAIPHDLIFHVRAVLRRTAPEQRARLAFGNLEIDLGAREVRVGGRPVLLTRREFDLLAYFALRPRQVVTYSELLDRVWGGTGDWQRHATVTEHVRRLRKKLNAGEGASGGRVVTMRGVGYSFRP